MKLSTVDTFKHIDTESCVVLDDVQLKKLQMILCDILKDIIEVCDAGNINYMLGGGSALGAVRHKGFIPWDDDMDINMPRADYDRFIKLFQEQKGDKYWLHTPEYTPGYNLLLARVRLKGTSVVTREDFFNDECGAFIDIFIMENTFDNKLLRYIHGLGSMAFGLLQSCRKFYRDRKQLMELANGSKELEKVFKTKIFIGFFTSFLSMQTWTRLANNWNRICKNHNSRYITIPSGRKYFFGELYLRKNMCVTQKVPFEDFYARCPKKVDRYLKRLYGDYMTIPAEADREKHVFLKPFKI